MAKEFTLCGKNAEELKKMGISDVAKLLPARQRRSLMRGHTEDQKKFLANLEQGKGKARTHCRDLIVTPQLIDKEIKIHTGKEWFMLKITVDMVGHYLGEFAMTRKMVKHSGPGVGATRSSRHQSVK